MTKVAILPVPTLSGEISYHALAGAKQSYGMTAGAALDALTIQLDDDEQDTLVVVQNQKPAEPATFVARPDCPDPDR